MAIFHTGKLIEFSVLPVGGAGVAVYDDSADPANGIEIEGEIDTVTIDQSANAATADTVVYNKETGETVASHTNAATKVVRKWRCRKHQWAIYFIVHRRNRARC